MRSRALLCLALLPAVLASCRLADAAPPPKRPTVAVEYYQIDSARVIAKWNRPCDGKGCADSYDVKWSAGVHNRARTTSVATDTFRLPRPNFGDSVLATVNVVAIRRTIVGPSRSASTYIRNPDGPPPAIDSLKVDTTAVPRADSSRLRAFTAQGEPIAGPLVVVEHDSILLVQEKWFPPGTVRRDVTRWSDDGVGTVRFRPIDPRGDSVWLVALSCNCAESGRRVNPPQLDLRNGGYAVRDRYGGAVPVTPLSADPFAR